VQAFDFLPLAFHFPYMRFKFLVMLPVEGGGEICGGDGHGESRFVAEARLVVHVFEERGFDDELFAVRAVGYADANSAATSESETKNMFVRSKIVMTV
jgi:hypothetical protein